MILIVIFISVLSILGIAHNIQDIDLSNVVSLNLEFVEDIQAKLVLNKSDGSQSVVTINKFDPIHTILSTFCEKVPVADCDALMDTISHLFYAVYYTPVLPHATLEDFNGSRVDILRHIAANYPVSDYLEIGTFKNEAFNVALQLFPHAVGVDPNSGGTLRMTSDEYFANNTEMFDLIFVDGLHEANQVFRDVHNALDILKPGKQIVLRSSDA